MATLMAISYPDHDRAQLAMASVDWLDYDKLLDVKAACWVTKENGELLVHQRGFPSAAKKTLGGSLGLIVGGDLRPPGRRAGRGDRAGCAQGEKGRPPDRGGVHLVGRVGTGRGRFGDLHPLGRGRGHAPIGPRTRAVRRDGPQCRSFPRATRGLPDPTRRTQPGDRCHRGTCDVATTSVRETAASSQSLLADGKTERRRNWHPWSSPQSRRSGLLLPGRRLRSRFASRWHSNSPTVRRPESIFG